MSTVGLCPVLQTRILLMAEKIQDRFRSIRRILFFQYRHAFKQNFDTCHSARFCYLQVRGIQSFSIKSTNPTIRI